MKLTDAWKTNIMPLIGIIAWVGIALTYLNFSHSLDRFKVDGLILLIGQTGLDMVIVVSALILICKVKRLKKIYLFIAFAFLLELVCDSSYNLIIHVLDKYPLSGVSESIMEISFSGFLIFQFLTWLSVLKIEKMEWDFHNILTPALFALPVVTIAAVLFLFYVHIFSWKISVTSLSGFYQLNAIVLNLLNFSVLIPVLACVKNRSILFMAAGVVALLGSDLIERFSILSETYVIFSNLQIIWFLGQILFVIGILTLIQDNKQDDYSNWLYPVNSIHVKYTGWCYLLCVFSLILTLLCMGWFSGNSKELNNDIIRIISPIFIFLSGLIVLASNLFTKRMLSAFHYIHTLVNLFMQKETAVDKMPTRVQKIKVHEIRDLESCLMESFRVLKERNEVQRSLLDTAKQVAHDIRSPLAALNAVVKNTPHIPEEQRIMIRNASLQINDIANNLLCQYRHDQGKRI